MKILTKNYYTFCIYITIILLMKDLSKNPYVYVIEDEQSISDLISLYLSQSELGTKAFSIS